MCTHYAPCTFPRMLPPAARMLRRPAKVLNPIILGLQGRRTCPKGSPPFQMKLVSAYIEQCSQSRETEIAEIAGSGSRLFQHHACVSRQAPVPYETGERPHRAMHPVKRLRLVWVLAKHIGMPSTRTWPALCTIHVPEHDAVPCRSAWRAALAPMSCVHPRPEW